MDATAPGGTRSKGMMMRQRKAVLGGGLRRCLLVGAAAVIASTGGCGGSDKPRQPIAVRPDLPEVPAPLRGLIGSEVEFKNVAPVLVSGYGLVVGLKGTGGLPLNDAIAASMERELGLMGVSGNSDFLKGTALEGKTPGEVLRDPNVAVVAVRGAVSPGAPEGTTFDVLVEATNATSLEGGRLWTTDLRLGPPVTFQQVQARKIAKARGAVYINAFTDAGEAGAANTVGRVLGGGVVSQSMNVTMVMRSPSHARARAIVSAINSRFPSGAGDPRPTAIGRSDSQIDVAVPLRYRHEAAEFLSLIRNLQIDQSAPAAYARRYVEAIKNEPQYAEAMSWALEGLGPMALPVTRELYDHPELAPRMAGLKAGARLNDARVAAPLKDLAKSGRGTIRTRAISLLGLVDAGPTVDLTLRELLGEEDLLVRVEAYEALAQRAEKAQFLHLLRLQEQSPDLRRQRLSPAELEVVARESLPSGTLQSVSRVPVAGKFLLDRVPGGSPMIYVTQQGVPRVAVFGTDDAVLTDKVVSVWNGRLMIAASDKPGIIKVQHSPAGRPRVVRECRAGLTDLALTLARESSDVDPRPGLGLGYSEVVAVLSEVQEQKATAASFATETDKLQGELLAAASARNVLERPENPDDKPEDVVIRPGSLPERARQAPEPPKIIPIEPLPKAR
ncbi:MAG TPA: flagellar basal body P-ring protein FlgI [Phycisphaerales bacterium]|nr:flagellar basal body P-ring protein FlgI [Phycisphaerales bacterium]